MDLRIYLSGSIKKGKNDVSKNFYWTDDDISLLKEILQSKYNLTILNPAIRKDDLSDSKSVFGRDLLQVYIADIVLVDAREKKGLGVGGEMLFAKDYGIPIITIAPQNSHYVKNDFDYLGQHIDKWIHPFISSLSDYIVDNIKDSADLILKEYPFKDKSIKGREQVISSMIYYIDTQLNNDYMMKELLHKNECVRTRINYLKECGTDLC